MGKVLAVSFGTCRKGRPFLFPFSFSLSSALDHPRTRRVPCSFFYFFYKNGYCGARMHVGVPSMYSDAMAHSRLSRAHYGGHPPLRGRGRLSRAHYGGHPPLHGWGRLSRAHYGGHPPLHGRGREANHHTGSLTHSSTPACPGRVLGGSGFNSFPRVPTDPDWTNTHKNLAP